MHAVARQAEMAQALQWFARERTWINERHLELCRVPAPTFFESARAEWFRERLIELNWNATLDRAGNVVATYGKRPSEFFTVVSAHLDTVYAPARPEDIYFSGDGRLVGPGTSDNGCGLAGLLALARVLTSSDELRLLASSVLLVANVGEEGEGNLSGMRYLCQHVVALDRIQGFLVLDGPSTDHITIQALASQRYEIGFGGPGGHSWNDQGLPNPVHVLAETISAFSQRAEAFTLEQPRGIFSYNFGVIEGGTSINSIPSHARAKLDIRSEDTAILEALSGLIASTVERVLERANSLARTGRLTAKIKDLGLRPGGQLRADAFLLRAVRAVDGHLNIRSRVDCASTDANVPLSLGLPAISIGAGGHGGGAHTQTEWYQPDGRELGLRRALLLLGVLTERQRQISLARKSVGAD